MIVDQDVIVIVDQMRVEVISVIKGGGTTAGQDQLIDIRRQGDPTEVDHRHQEESTQDVQDHRQEGPIEMMITVAPGDIQDRGHLLVDIIIEGEIIRFNKFN